MCAPYNPPADSREELSVRLSKIVLAGAATVALSLLAEMLTREPDGPLYQQLVKPGYAVNVGASSSDLYDPGMLLFSATLASEDKRQIVWDTLRKVVEGELPLSQEALDRTKQDVKNSMQRLADGRSGQAHRP